MPELRTSECSLVDHPELVVRFSRPDDEPHLRAWLDSMIEMIWDGSRFKADDVGSLFGWSVRFGAEGDDLAVYSDDLTGPDDAPRFVPDVDRAAEWTRNQRELADGYGLPFAGVGIRYGKVMLCPEVAESSRDAWHLARSSVFDISGHITPNGWVRGPVPHETGWYIACPDAISACKGRGPRGRWIPVRVHALLTERPDLVPFLGLPPGAVVNTGYGLPVKVGRHPADVNLEPEWNILRLSRDGGWIYDMERGIKWATLRPGSAWDVRVNGVGALDLDPVRDPEIGVPYNRFYIPDIMKRYGVNRPTAEKALRDAMKPERWECWLFAQHREQFPPGLYEVIRPELDAEPSERWRLHDDIARRHLATAAIPFAKLKQRVEALDRALQTLRKRATDIAERGAGPLYDFD